MPALADDVRTLFAGPNIAHIATVGPDGSPHSVAIWAGLHGDHVCFFTQERSRKARNLRADPRVAVSLVIARTRITRAGSGAGWSRRSRARRP
jgi:PPOX class probable F420-dependent enzyme